MLGNVKVIDEPAPAIRAKTGRFLPGQSGNPRGRPAESQETKDGKAMLRKAFPAAVETVVSILSEPGAARSYGTEPDIIGVPGIHVECKRHERTEIGAWMEQAERDAARFGGRPCVFHRRNREEWRVTMPLDAWVELYKAWLLSAKKQPGNEAKLEREIRQTGG